jgi:hypothetical protein
MVEILLEFVAPARELHRPGSESGVSLEGQITKLLMKAVGRVRVFGARRVLRGVLSYKIPGSERQPVGNSGCEPRFTSCEVPS